MGSIWDGRNGDVDAYLHALRTGSRQLHPIPRLAMQRSRASLVTWHKVLDVAVWPMSPTRVPCQSQHLWPSHWQCNGARGGD